MAAVREPDVDLGQVGRRLRRRALVLVLFSVSGLASGYLAWRLGERNFRARTVLFVTQSSALAQPSALAAIAHSQSVLEAAARQTGLPVQRLAASLAAAPVGSAPVGGALYFQVSVDGKRKKATLAASRLIGSALLDRVQLYQVAQTASAKAQLVQAGRELAQTQQRAALAGSLSPGPLAIRLTVLALIQQAENTTLSRIRHFRAELAQAQAQRSLISASSVAPVGARSRLSSALVGAIIGLLIGVLASLAYPPSRYTTRFTP